MLTRPVRYRIRVQGRLGPEWAASFGGFVLTWEAPGETVLVGRVTDQAALHGLLNTVRDLGMPLLEVQCLEPGAPETADQ